MADEAPGPLARRDGDPVFDEPWQAQTLAIAATMTAAGTFTAQQWSTALGAELERARERGEPDGPETYYAAALAALEHLLTTDGRLTGPGIAARADAWRRAYLATPHGQPVELAAGERAGR